MAVPQAVLNKDEGLRDWCILHGYRGSIAHGMYEPPSQPTSIDDKDTMAFCVPPLDYYYGLKEYGSRGTKEIVHGEWDIVVYELRKVVRLLRQGNPNVLSLLWLPDSLYIKRTIPGDLLIHRRSLFTGKWAYMPFVGYAKGQLHRMTHNAFKGYMGEKRKRLVEEFGYDTKNASHLIRLLRMGIEFLQTGTLTVDRGGYDATELLEIKHGEWSLEKVKSEAERLFIKAEDAVARSSLPTEPDREAINELCVHIITLATGRKEDR